MSEIEEFLPDCNNPWQTDYENSYLLYYYDCEKSEWIYEFNEDEAEEAIICLHNDYCMALEKIKSLEAQIAAINKEGDEDESQESESV